MLPDWEMILRLLIAAALGSIIGAERERLVWAAGLRTHMLVCVGACLVMIVSSFGFSDIINNPKVMLDPSRVAAQVVSGIGFLGAGSILLRGEVIRGLTTAASLWTVAAVGLAVGSGLYVEACAATVIILGILAGVKPFEERFLSRSKNYEISMKADRGQMSFEGLNKALGVHSRRLTRYVAHPAEDPAVDNISITLRRLSVTDTAVIVQHLEALPYIRTVDPPNRV